MQPELTQVTLKFDDGTTMTCDIYPHGEKGILELTDPHANDILFDYEMCKFRPPAVGLLSLRLYAKVHQFKREAACQK